MKIRTGFVSNSSSSSFIVAFKKVPTTIKEMEKILFADDIGYPAAYPKHRETKVWPTIKIAQIVFNDLKKQKKSANLTNITECIDKGHHPKHPNFFNDEYQNIEDQDEKWKKYYMDKLKISTDLAKIFLNENQNSKIYIFEYADEDGYLGSDMEHGTLFERLNHIKVSNH